MRALVLLILSVACMLALGCTQQNQEPPVVTQTTPNAPSEMSAETTITIVDFQFQPSTLTVKAGTTVTWVNEDSVPHLVASDPHPTHTDLPGLDSGELQSNQMYSFNFTKKGTFGYHCHLHPSMTGTIVVG